MNEIPRSRGRRSRSLSALLRRCGGTLTREDEADLARRIAEGDLSARDELVLNHAAMAYSHAVSWSRSHVQTDDLFSEALVGLLMAAPSFNPEKSRFSTYGRIHVRSRMMLEVERAGRSFSSSKERSTKVLFAHLPRVKWRLGIHHSPMTAREAEDVAARFGIADATMVADAERDVEDDLRIDVDTAPDDSPWLVDRNTPDPFELAAERDATERMRRAIASAMRQIGPRNRRIVRARHLSDQPPELRLLAEKEGISYQRVQQIMDAAMTRIRRHIERTDPDLLETLFGRGRQPSADAVPPSAMDHVHPDDIAILAMMDEGRRERVLAKIDAVEEWIALGKARGSSTMLATRLDVGKAHFLEIAARWTSRRRVCDIASSRRTIKARGETTPTDAGARSAVRRAMLDSMAERARIMRMRDPWRTELSIYQEVVQGMDRPPSIGAFSIRLQELGIPKRKKMATRPADRRAA